MKALVKNGNTVAALSCPRPEPEEYEVLINVNLAGLCRTDVYAAQGKLQIKDPLVLGHELAGTIAAVGKSVDLTLGSRVTVNPILRCGKCNRCKLGETCSNTGFIGLDRDGGFAEYVKVPAYTVMPLPEQITFMQAAYTEPVAASLAVLNAGILPTQSGAIFGKNRFSQLMQLILDVTGYPRLPVYDLNSADDLRDLDQLEGTFDYVIETYASSAVLTEMVKAVKPGGKVILKSRQYLPVEFKLIDVLKKEPVIHVCNYGSFEQALDLLSTGKLDISGLVDDIYKLDDFEKVFDAAQCNETLKQFFDPQL